MSGSTRVREIEVPERLGVDEVAELAAQLRAAGADDVVVLRGRERAFCKGLALAEVAKASSPSLHAAVHGFADVLLRLRELPCPTVALVEGSARGGGVGLAAACDVVLAGRDASFSLPEAVFGLTPAIITPFVVERIGARRLRYLALSCTSLDATAAQRIGLVDQTAPSRVGATLRRLVRVLARVSPVAPHLVAATGPSHAQVHAAAEETLQRLLDPTVAARIDAFISGGAAPWQVPA